jgi:hypothetical protein
MIQNLIEFGGMRVKFLRIDGIWLRCFWLHLYDTLTQERKFGISNFWVFSIWFKNLIRTPLNFDFELLRNEINQWIWSLINALMKVISVTVTRGVTIDVGINMERKDLMKQTSMTNVNPKYVMGQTVLLADQLREVGQYRFDLHNYYIQNYKTGQDIMVQFKDSHFVVGDHLCHHILQSLRPFQTWRVGYLSNTLLHIVSPQKLISSIYMLYM